MKFLFREYSLIPRSILLIILAEFFIQFVNASFMNLQPLYMKVEGYSDPEIANIISWRFAGVLLLALPLGFWIKGKPVRNLFYASSIGVPLFGLLIILCTHFKSHDALVVTQFFWGASFTFMQIPILPYILRNSPLETQTSAIALSYSTWSFAGIVSAVLVWVLNSADPVWFSERNMLIGITALSFAGIFCVRAARMKENTNQEAHESKDTKYDWSLIAKALIPALVIATGAGLTIPFINLFFSGVHHLSTGTISLWNFVAALLVAFAALLVPRIKKSIGYKMAIPLTQSFAVISLVLLATTEWYTHLSAAAAIAIGCYLLRQPLMNLAGPMTSEIGMKYVGKKNQEMTSALTAAIWSGSWFIGGRFIVGSLLGTGWPYVSIFLITAALYAAGVILYVMLIASYNKRVASGAITEE
ncbi:MAG TPA: MFS transporter [Bacteroidia bacterium]|nr:MFS transporter [Bacteroidia bacterium]